MSLLIVLRADRISSSAQLPAGIEVFDDPDAVVARLRESDEEVRWVVLAPDLDDPAGIAERLRAADPSAAIGLLSREPAALPSGAPPASGDLSSMEPPNPGSARAADVAHRLATPVTAILGYAELIEKSVGDQRNRVRAARIVEQAGRLSELLEELSDPKRAAKEPEAGERSGPG